MPYIKVDKLDSPYRSYQRGVELEEEAEQRVARQTRAILTNRTVDGNPKLGSRVNEPHRM